MEEQTFPNMQTSTASRRDRADESDAFFSNDLPLGPIPLPASSNNNRNGREHSVDGVIPLPPDEMPPKMEPTSIPRRSEDSWVKSNYLDQVAAAAEEKYGGFVEHGGGQQATTTASAAIYPQNPFVQGVAAGAYPSGYGSQISSQPVYYFDQQQQQMAIPANGGMMAAPGAMVVNKARRPALVGSPPPGASTTAPQMYAPMPSGPMAPSPMPAMPAPMHHHQQQYTTPGFFGPSSSVVLSSSYDPRPSTQPSFGLGVGKYGNEIPSPLDAEIQHTILEMQQELAFIDSLPQAPHLRHSKRLLKERCAKLETTTDPDWVEVDINKPIKVTKRVLVPTFRHSTFNYIGRILGPKGTTLQNICKKFKCFISIMGAGSTKDRARELELLNSNDARFSHYASPLHVRIDTVAPAHIAHMRMAACLNVFHKLLVPGKDVYIEGISPAPGAASASGQPTNTFQQHDRPTGRQEQDMKEADDLEGEFKYGDNNHDYDDEMEELRRHEGGGGYSNGGGGGPMRSSSRGGGRGGGSYAGPSRGASSSSRGSRGGGFVPRARGMSSRNDPY